VMREQLRSLIGLPNRPNVTLCEVPFSPSARAALESRLTLFEFSVVRDRSCLC
jgi:uncharacterized protein DUF5753